MRKFNYSLVSAMLVGALSSPLAFADDRPEFKVGLVNSVTGGASSIAAGAVATMNLIEERVNKDSSLPYKVTFIKYDDGSDPAKAVNSVRKLIQEDKADLVICCTTTPSSLAVNPVVNEAKVPNLSLASAASVIEPVAEREFIFKAPLTDRLMISYTIDYMLEKGYKTAGFMGLDDSYGEGGWVEFKDLAKEKGLDVIVSERFARGDTNFTPQSLRVTQENPDVVYFHAIPPSSALATAALKRAGYKGPIFHGAGSPTNSFLRVGKQSVNGALVGTTPFTVYKQLDKDHELLPVIEEFVNMYEAKHGEGKADMFAAQAYDTMLVALHALEVVASQGKNYDLDQKRLAIKDAIEGIKDFKGVNGLYSFSPENHLGLDERSTLLVEAKDGQFRLLEE